MLVDQMTDIIVELLEMLTSRGIIIPSTIAAQIESVISKMEALAEKKGERNEESV